LIQLSSGITAGPKGSVHALPVSVREHPVSVGQALDSVSLRPDHVEPLAVCVLEAPGFRSAGIKIVSK
jgi:hypothetical protein